jgi:hypothetical protein
MCCMLIQPRIGKTSLLEQGEMSMAVMSDYNSNVSIQNLAQRTESTSTLLEGGRNRLSPSSVKYRPYCCGYFRTRLGCCAVWSGCILLVLGLLGLVGYYYYPTIPTFVISKPFAAPNSTGLLISPSTGSALQAMLGANVTNPFSMTIKYAVNITVVSQMRWDVYVSVLSLKV